MRQRQRVRLRARRLAAVSLVAVGLLISALPASAIAVSPATLRSLASSAASGNRTALTALRGVTSVDGRPANLTAALSGASAGELRQRLAALAASVAGPPVDSATAREQAAALLSQPRYGGKPVLDPLSSVLNALGRELAKLASGAPGGPVAFWIVVAVVVLAFTLFGVRRTLRRLDPARAGGAVAAHAAEDPEDLERQARAAEAAGTFAVAVRLRFRAGLLSLARGQLIQYRSSLQTGEVARQLHLRQFDELAGRFEQIAYGGRTATAEDATAAREGWQRVLRAARR